MNRRTFLRTLLGATAAAATPAIVEPVRKLWFVPSTAPVGSRLADYNIHPDTYAMWAGDYWDSLSAADALAKLEGKRSEFDAFKRKCELVEDMADARLVTPDDLRRVLEEPDFSYAKDWDLLREPEPSGSLFGIEPGTYGEWKARTFSSSLSDAQSGTLARLHQEMSEQQNAIAGGAFTRHRQEISRLITELLTDPEQDAEVATRS